MKTLQKLGRVLGAVEGSLIVVILAAMVILGFLQVVLRNFFSTGILWIDPFLRHLVLWVGFIGASLATRNDRHIGIDILARYAPPRWGNLMRVLTNLAAAAVSIALASAAWTFVAAEREQGSELLTIGSTGFQAWWFQIIIPVGFGMIAFRFLLRTLERIISPAGSTAQK